MAVLVGGGGPLDTRWPGSGNVARAAPLAQSPRAYEATLLPEPGPGGTDRYTVRVRPGATLWDIATEGLPQIVLEQGAGAALDVVQQSFFQAFPGRQPHDVRLDDEFTLEVPAGTFVTASLTTPDRGRTIEYTSFRGDTLIEYRADPALVFRYVAAREPSRARVLLRAGTRTPAVDIARRAYQIDPPDYLQVRRVRAALAEDPPVLTIDLERPYLDPFRNYRDLAVAVEPSEEGLQLYRFDPEDENVPFLAVEDAIGDEWDPANFPRVARREYYRDGTIKRYLLTQPGDVLAVLARPNNSHWASITQAWSAWTDGEVEPLPPFAPAVNEVGSLLPGRLLVLVHRPRPTPGPATECLGIPLGLAATAGLARAWRRRCRTG